MNPYRCITIFSLIVISNAALSQTEGWVTPQYPNLQSGNGAPQNRAQCAAVWVGDGMWVFGGRDEQIQFNFLADGGVYRPATDEWKVLPHLSGAVNAPAPRARSSAVWMGTAVVVFGGNAHSVRFNDGGIYDPAIDRWLPRPNLNGGIGAPSARFDCQLMWTGDRVLVFGGSDVQPVSLYELPIWTGGVYDPATDTWENKPTLATPVSAPEFCWGAVWTGEHLVARGGFGGTVVVHPGTNGFTCSAGGVYDPSADVWLPRPTLRSGQHAYDVRDSAAVWTGEYYLEAGGKSQSTPTSTTNTGVCYAPSSDSFLSRSALNTGQGAPWQRWGHSAIWTGSHLVVWSGGHSTAGLPSWSNIGGLYDPIGDQWYPTSALQQGRGAPSARLSSATVWTGSEIVTWGGSYNFGPPVGSIYYPDGGVYVPPRVAPTFRSGAPTGATQTTWPMGGVPPGGEQVDVGVFWRHRVTVYGCPRSTVTVTGMPGWMMQKYLDTGCFLEGTPGPGDNHKLHQISIVASNGIGVDAIQSFTLKVGNPLPPSQFFTQPVTTAIAGELYQYTPLAVGTPTPIVVMTVGPSWLTWVGNKLQGRPPYSASATSVQVRLEAVAQGQSTGAQDFLIHVDYSPYDIDRDKSVDVVDVQTTVNLILSVATPTYPTQGDTDASGIVDVVDVQRIVNTILMP